MCKLARESLQEARRSVWGLRSGPLTGHSLIQALEEEAVKCASANLQPTFEATGRERAVPAGVKAALLRICQGALANVLKHANAGHVTVTLGFGRSKVKLTISDDSIGFDFRVPSQWSKDGGGFGLVNMGERAQLLCGELAVKSELIRGTEVTAVLPAQLQVRI